MRVALISDLHGNQIALDAVLADIRRVGVDQIVCLGDTATLGPDPERVLATLRDLGCVCIMGNHDDFLLDDQLIRSYTELPMIVDAVDWCRAQLSADELAFVRTFVPGVTIDLGAGSTLSLYHGTPRSNMEDLVAVTAPPVVDEMLARGGKADVYAGGHTHLQMLRQHKGALIVNPGSVGLPFQAHVSAGPPTIMRHAEYATVEPGSVTLRRVALEADALRAAAAARDFPMRAALVAQYA